MKEGDKLHTFTILEDLGHGGMGGVYIGFDTRTKQLCAIKTLFQEFSRDEAYVRRFQREAEVYQKLSHPNIVAFVDAGFENGVYFIAMEHIKGKALDDIIRDNGALPYDMCAKIMGHLVDAIGHAHTKGVIHRDLKPANIMINEEGEVKLLDFGIAQADDNLVNTVTGSIIGTFFYSAPEQNQGKKVDERSDLYSMGLVFYEMVTGQRALNGATLLEVTAAQMRNAIPSPSAIVADLPPAIEKIVLKAIAKNPDDRYQNADEFLKDLMAFRDNPDFDPDVAGFDNEELAETWNRAQDALVKKDYDFALELAQKVADHKKDSADVYMLLGKIYAAKNVAFQATESFEKAVKLEPDNDELRLQYAIALYNLGLLDKSKKLLKEVLDNDSDNLYGKRYMSLILDHEEEERRKEEAARIAKTRALAKAQQAKEAAMQAPPPGGPDQPPAPAEGQPEGQDDGKGGWSFWPFGKKKG